MKVAIVGSRTLNIEIDEFIPKNISSIISGGARGVDQKAYEYAKFHNIPITIIKPDYLKYDKIAPIIRNKTIVNSSDSLLAIWDGFSRGTKNAIDLARLANKEVNVYIVKNGKTFKVNFFQQIKLF